MLHVLAKISRHRDFDLGIWRVNLTDREFRLTGRFEAPTGATGDCMHWDRIEGAWKQFGGKAREQWGRLTEDDVAQSIVCGPDPERHLDAIREYADAGYDHVYVHQVGPDQDGAIRFYEDEVLPKIG